MGIRTNLVFAFLVAGALVSGCAGGNAVTKPHGIGVPRSAASIPTTPEQQAAEALLPASVQQKLKAGYHFQVAGTVHGTVDVALGRQPTFHFSPGDQVTVSLVPANEPKYLLTGYSRDRKTDALPVDCADCVGGGSGTPAPRATPPPNYVPCSSSGGATWFDVTTGEGGCTPRGSSKPLSCGVWTWSSRGKGTLTVPGTGTFPDLDWVTDNRDGSCGLGYLKP